MCQAEKGLVHDNNFVSNKIIPLIFLWLHTVSQVTRKVTINSISEMQGEIIK